MGFDRTKNQSQDDRATAGSGFCHRHRSPPGPASSSAHVRAGAREQVNRNRIPTASTFDCPVLQGTLQPCSDRFLRGPSDECN
uniref:WGS project CBMG000000000 data, contig CS5907-c003865 n=1 Tax=Fusarium acuminatum CS5907 TaxID=1318461 RepID=A0A090MEA4_9HYPO|nr:unnamed protein product [Fusarium acuminatum CS5907]